MELCTVTREASRTGISTEEGIMLLDTDGRCIHLSDTAASLLGRHPEKTRDIPLQELLQPTSEDGDNVMNTLRDGGRLLYRSLRNNGNATTVEIRFHRVASNGRHPQYVGVVRNLDMVKQMERNLQSQLCRERLFKECISHHFFNPLCIAQGYLQLVLNRESNGDDEAMLEAARQALARIETVVKNVIYDGELKE